MDEAEFRARGLDIWQLIPKCDRFLFDTCALHASNAPIREQIEYRNNLRKAAQENKNIYTIDEVYSESNLVSLASPGNVGVRKIKIETYNPQFQDFFDYLEPEARMFNIADEENESHQADLKLAAMTFAMNAREGLRTVFISSDRRLMDFMFKNYAQIKSANGKIRSAPLIGRTRFYTLVSKFAKFFPYSTERDFQISQRKLRR